jgi:hypothetical protein
MPDYRDEPEPDGLGILPDELLAPFRKQSQAEFEIEFFDSILARSSDYVDVLRCQGELLSRKGYHERALAVDRRLAKLVPYDGVVHYNLACSLARNGLGDDCLASLRRALERGYDDFEYLDLDTDFETMRSDPRFTTLVDEFRPRPAAKRRSKTRGKQ